jgi:formiminotetrahydrofolate cyclodeaminase
LEQDDKTFLTSLKVRTFLEELASDSPAPGGGSVAALCGALSASLLSMVSNLTIKNERFSHSKEDMKQCLAESQRFKEDMIEAVDDDTEAFYELMSAYKSKVKNSKSGTDREYVIQKALQRTIDVPLRVAKVSVALLKLALEISRKGIPGAITDTGVAALVADTGLKGAIYNVQINLRSLHDADLKHELEETVQGLLREGESYRNDIMAQVRDKLV